MFIYILYSFRATMCPSSGELTISMRYQVYVTMCGRPSGMQVRMEFHPAYQTVVHAEWHKPGIAVIQLILLIMGT